MHDRQRRGRGALAPTLGQHGREGPAHRKRLEAIERCGVVGPLAHGGEQVGRERDRVAAEAERDRRA